MNDLKKLQPLEVEFQPRKVTSVAVRWFHLEVLSHPNAFNQVYIINNIMLHPVPVHPVPTLRSCYETIMVICVIMFCLLRMSIQVIVTFSIFSYIMKYLRVKTAVCLLFANTWKREIFKKCSMPKLYRQLVRMFRNITANQAN